MGITARRTGAPLKSPELDYDTFHKIRNFSQMLNEAAKKNMAPFANDTIDKSLRRILKD